jgi:hypothetical protein
MSAKKKRARISGEGRDVERIKDPRAGLERMRNTLKKLLKVPKSAIANGSRNVVLQDGEET